MFGWWRLGYLHCHPGWRGTRLFDGSSSAGFPPVVEYESLSDLYRGEELREMWEKTREKAGVGPSTASLTTSGYTILSPLQVSCHTIRLPASSTQPRSEESMWAKARSVTAPVKPFSNERSAKLTLRMRIIAWLFAPGEDTETFNKYKKHRWWEHYPKKDFSLFLLSLVDFFGNNVVLSWNWKRKYTFTGFLFCRLISFRYAKIKNEVSQKWNWMDFFPFQRSLSLFPHTSPVKR